MKEAEDIEEDSIQSEETQRESEEAEIRESEITAFEESERELQLEDDSKKTSQNSEDKFEVFQELSRKLAEGNFDDPEKKEKVLIKIQDDYLRAIQKSDEIAESTKTDPEYNAYNFARSASVLALEHAWIKLRPKMDLLKNQVHNSPLRYGQTIMLNDVFTRFERDCIKKIIDSKKPNNKKDNQDFESYAFYHIILSTTSIYSDFFDAFLGDVKFDYQGAPWLNSGKNSEKFRYFVSDLRHKRKLDDIASKPHTPNYQYCDAQNGEEQSRKSEKKYLFQGYWQVENMIKELRNHTEHCMQDNNKSFLRNKLDRMIKDPVTEINSAGNFFTLISVVLLMTHQFIEVMQTWVDTVKLVEE